MIKPPNGIRIRAELYSKHNNHSTDTYCMAWDEEDGEIYFEFNNYDLFIPIKEIVKVLQMVGISENNVDKIEKEFLSILKEVKNGKI